MDIKPYEEKVISSSLMTTVPKPGKLSALKKMRYLGTTELTLNNGVTVTLNQLILKTMKY